MAFVASPGTRTTIASGGGNIAVAVPQVIDVSGNGYNGNLFSHYQLGANIAVAIPPQTVTLSVPQGAAAADLYFGKMD